MALEGIKRRTFFQEALRVFARAVNAIDETDLCAAITVNLLDEINVPFGIGRQSVSERTACILNFAPAKRELAFNSGKQRFLALGRSRLWNVLSNEFLGIVRQHAGGLA